MPPIIGHFVAAVDSSITKINTSEYYTFHYYFNVTGNIGIMNHAIDSTIFIPTCVHIGFLCFAVIHKIQGECKDIAIFCNKL